LPCFPPITAIFAVFSASTEFNVFGARTAFLSFIVTVIKAAFV